jgi:hypothetical protein
MLERKMADLTAEPGNIMLLGQMLDSVRLAQRLPFAVDLRRVQSLYYHMLKVVYPEFQNKAKAADKAAKDWVTQFVSLGNKLSIFVV